MNTRHDRVNPVSLVDRTTLHNAPSVVYSRHPIEEARKNGHIDLNVMQHTAQQNHHSSLDDCSIAVEFHIACPDEMLGPDLCAQLELSAEGYKLRCSARGSPSGHHTVRRVSAFKSLPHSIIPPESPTLH